jgi:hypothetical protein
MLREIPAEVRFLSCEPLLADPGVLDLKGIDWVIVGAESRPHGRPMHPGWVRRIKSQCEDAGVAFYLKQWGEWVPVGHASVDERLPRNERRLNLAGGRDSHGDEVWLLRRVGKTKAGSLFDAQLHCRSPPWSSYSRLRGAPNRVETARKLFGLNSSSG